MCEASRGLSATAELLVKHQQSMHDSISVQDVVIWSNFLSGGNFFTTVAMGDRSQFLVFWRFYTYRVETITEQCWMLYFFFKFNSEHF